jgi:hypothetical protein
VVAICPRMPARNTGEKVYCEQREEREKIAENRD